MNSINTDTTTTQPAEPAALALPAPGRSAVETATQLLAYLAPLFPGVASMTRTEAGAAGWIAAWATQIEAEGIGPQRLAGTLTLLGQLDPDVPLSWPRFSELVRRHRFTNLHLPEEDEQRERKLREFKAKYPGAKFVNGPGAGPGAKG